MVISRNSDFPECRPPCRFGQHPGFERSFKKWRREVLNGLRRGELCDTVQLDDIPKVGRVYLIPKDRYIEIVDGFGDRIAIGSPDNAMFPFSSYDFFADIYDDEYFKELLEQPFFRLGKISQLGYLVPPKPEGWKQDVGVTVVYLAPHFSHTRWAHSRLVAFLMEIILARHGYAEKERFPVVLTSAYHDIATPAGGDSVKRVDAEGLNEEENFEWVLRCYSLVQKWSDEYGFDIEKAKEWVKGIGLFGRLLDIIDRIAYTALDCYYVGFSRPCRLRSFGLENPLVMDVWQDLQFNDSHSDFAFTDPNRLFKFLLFRAFEHGELLMNPYSRALDFSLQKLVQPLYEKGIITWEQLLLGDDDWLHTVLREHYPNKNVWAFIEPESLSWRKFDTLEELERFCSANETTYHIEYMKGFDTGLHLGVYNGKKIAPVRESLADKQIEELEEISRQARGYYAYYIKE